MTGAGDEEGVPGVRRDNRTGVSGAGKSNDQRMPLGRSTGPIQTTKVWVNLSPKSHPSSQRWKAAGNCRHRDARSGKQSNNQIDRGCAVCVRGAPGSRTAHPDRGRLVRTAGGRDVRDPGL